MDARARACVHTACVDVYAHVHVHVCVYVHVHVYVYVYVYVHVYVYLHVCVWMCTCMCMFMRVYIFAATAEGGQGGAPGGSTRELERGGYAAVSRDCGDLRYVFLCRTVLGAYLQVARP